MKKIITTFICLVLAFLLVSCNNASNVKNNASNVKIDALEDALASVFLDRERSFEKTKTNSGYSFNYEESSFVCDIECSGIADEKENVSSVTITNNDVDTSILTDFNQLSKTMSKSSDQLSMRDIRAGNCVLEVWLLMDAFGYDSSSETESEAIITASSLFNGETITVGKWTISAEFRLSSNQVVIDASYD